MDQELLTTLQDGQMTILYQQELYMTMVQVLELEPLTLYTHWISMVTPELHQAQTYTSEQLD